MRETLYRCRNCEAVFSNPSGNACPACEKQGPMSYDVDGENSYRNNWYERLGTVVFDE